MVRRQFDLQLAAYKEMLNLANQIVNLRESISPYSPEYDRQRAICYDMWDNQLQPKFEQTRLVTLLVLEADFGRNSRFYDIFESYSGGDISAFGNKKPIHGAISALTAMEVFIVDKT